MLYPRHIHKTMTAERLLRTLNSTIHTYRGLRGVCNQGERVVDVDLEECVAEVDIGVSVKQCVEWDGRDTSGITQDQLILNGPWQRRESNALNYFWLYFAIFIY